MDAPFDGLLKMSFACLEFKKKDKFMPKYKKIQANLLGVYLGYTISVSDLL